VNENHSYCDELFVEADGGSHDMFQALGAMLPSLGVILPNLGVISRGNGSVTGLSQD
jgi:hypothetical protein